ncbi:MAG TPA: hypothetical protein GXZ35_05645 [Acholeplasmataceae bacterium]|nr:hypothetical protein [Acholeplasmataceae bacterium]
MTKQQILDLADDSIFGQNLYKYVEFCSWCRFYPDLFLDLIKPEIGGINLHSDQRVYLRCIMRFVSLYGVFPRGYGKTYDEVLAMHLVAIFFPSIDLAMTAQTKENAAELIKDKHNEIIKHFPMLENELADKAKFSKGDAEISFKSDSRIDNLANANSSKGQRRKRINIEESALLNDEMFQDVLKPIVEVPRYTVGKYGVVDPCELNQQINFFTTSGFRGSDEYQRNITMLDGMAKLTGEMVLGSSWFLSCWYGRGSTKSQILKKKKEMSPIAFAQNYESKWVGCSDGALVNINKLMSCRSLTSPQLKTNNDEEEFYLGVDVARSQNTNNNQSAIVVAKVIRSKDMKIISIDIVNIISVSNILNFTAQACKVKQIQKLYNAKAVIVDGNGLGAGLIDELLKESFDPITKESLGCWDTINTDNTPELNESEKIVYDLKAQSVQNKVVTTFIDMVDSGKLRLLCKKQLSEFSEKELDDIDNKVAPFLQTDNFFEETANLKLKHLPSGGVTIEKVVKKLDKDRVSACIYVLWYINEFCRDLTSSDYDFCVFVN